MAIYRPNRLLARILIVGLILLPLVGPLTLPLSWDAVDNLVEATNQFSQLDIEAAFSEDASPADTAAFNDATDEIVRTSVVLLGLMLPAMVLGVGTLILLSMWSYRSFRNLEVFGRWGIGPGPALAAIVWWFGGGLGGGFVLNRLWRGSGTDPDWRRNPGTRWAWVVVLGGFLAAASGFGFYIWWLADSGWIVFVGFDEQLFEESRSIPEIPPYPLGVELLAAITAVTSALFAWPTAWLVWRLIARQEDRWRETRTDRRMDEVWRLRSLGLIDETERHRLERAIRSNAPAR